jgi:pre-mRNA-splicing factor CWC22
MEQPTGGRTGGIYIPPFKLALLKQQASLKDDPASLENQKLSWEALRKSLNGLINKVNVANIKNIIPELFQENLIRGRGLFARAIMKAQLASPGFTPIYSALIAVINTKLPENGELILKRVIYGFKRAYKRRDKITATALAKFIAHLVNHQIAHELLSLQLLTVLLEEPTDDSVEIAVGFVKEVGQILQELSPQGLHAIMERFRAILHEGDIDKRVQYTIEGLFAIWKSDFKDFPAIPKELDLVEREDQITFEIGLVEDEELDREEMLDVFRFDKNFHENEQLWEKIKKEILGEDDEEEGGETDGEGRPGNEDDEGEGNEEREEGALTVMEGGDGTNNNNKILDLTEQDLINLRRQIYLTIMSSVSFEECCHKLVKLNIPAGYEHELCNMLVECCANERSYLRYYGLMGQRFCMMHIKYQNAFDDVFLQQYNTIHRLETNKLRNVAKFFSHLLGTDALPWTCFEYIKLNERDTTSSSRIFIKVLIQDLSEILGLSKLRDRFSDPYMQDIFNGMFPRDNARDTRFAINFFTSIGLGGLTDGLREHLKNMPKLLAAQMQAQLAAQQQQAALVKKKEEEDESDDDSSASSTSSSSDSDSSDSSSSDSDNDSGSDSSSSSSSSDSDSDADSVSSGSSSSSSSSSSTSSSVSSAAKRKTSKNSTKLRRSASPGNATRSLNSPRRRGNDENKNLSVQVSQSSRSPARRSRDLDDDFEKSEQSRPRMKDSEKREYSPPQKEGLSSGRRETRERLDDSRKRDDRRDEGYKRREEDSHRPEWSKRNEDLARREDSARQEGDARKRDVSPLRPHSDTQRRPYDSGYQRPARSSSRGRKPAVSSSAYEDKSRLRDSSRERRENYDGRKGGSRRSRDGNRVDPPRSRSYERRGDRNLARDDSRDREKKRKYEDENYVEKDQFGRDKPAAADSSAKKPRWDRSSSK